MERLAHYQIVEKLGEGGMGVEPRVEDGVAVGSGGDVDSGEPMLVERIR